MKPETKIALMTGLIGLHSFALAAPQITEQPSALQSGLSKLMYGQANAPANPNNLMQNLMSGMLGPIQSGGSTPINLSQLLGPGSGGLLSNLLQGGGQNLLGNGLLGNLVSGNTDGLLSGLLGGSPLGGMLSGGTSGLLTGLLGNSPISGVLNGLVGGGGGLGGMLSGMLGSGGLGGMLGSLLGGGGLTGMLSMIPGAGWIAGAIPMLGSLMNGSIGGILGNIPGVSQLMSMLGLGGSAANLGPLTKQMNDTGKYTQALNRVVKTSENVVSTEKLQNFSGDLNTLARMTGSSVKFTSAQVQANPKAAAKQMVDLLSQKQAANIAKMRAQHTPEAIIGQKAANDVLEQMKLNARRNGENALALQDVKKTSTEVAERAAENVQFRQDASKAVYQAKKTEDVLKLSSAIQLEQMRMTALNSAALTSALANQTAVEVSQAEALNGILTEIQSERLAKANKLMEAIDQQERQQREEAEQISRYTNNISEGMNRTMNGSSLKGVDMMKGE